MPNTFTITGRLAADVEVFSAKFDPTDFSDERVWRHVRIGKPSECWEWTRARHLAGKWHYGRVGFAGREYRAHLLAWESTHGTTVPPGMVVRHTCDNPPCCNPAHLVLGTPAENTRDMIERGRAVRTQSPGERNGSAKLTVADVVQIRSDRLAGLSLSRLAAKYGISKGHASRVVNNINWKA